ncbi:beta/gamma crystallin family protein [Synechococcus sp. Nb3U1]|uniref:beta/gamma crystallin-related protein n=1 Tax=Synechococcus sp. Nb3U1 TaxID=1914529 RepID=UPI001F2F1D11|nr:beta/gamma crystallin-related protein [Synechococcus sp. Nb3U1]MCF2971696.1 beta/gamma crystallin family protein [Synechococcus sp. Nb3U1]
MRWVSGGGSGGSVLPPSGGIQPLPQPIGSLILYENANYQGRSLGVSDSLRDLNTQGFNDLTTSLQINSGVWDLCEDVNWQGYCRRLGPGRYPDVRLVGINNDTISSVRLVSVDGSGGSGGTILLPPSVVYPPYVPSVPPPRDNYGRDSSGCLDGYYRQGAYCVRY